MWWKFATTKNMTFCCDKHLLKIKCEASLQNATSISILLHQSSGYTNFD